MYLGLLLVMLLACGKSLTAAEMKEGKLKGKLGQALMSHRWRKTESQ